MHALAALLLALPLAVQDPPLFQARFVDQDGRALAGVEVLQRGAARAISDGQGRVELPMTVPRLRRVEASLPGYQDLAWDVGREACDLGEVVLAPEAVPVGRIVGDDGETLGGNWRVAITTRDQADKSGRLDFTRDVALDPESGEFRIGGLPAGDVDLIARHLKPADVGKLMTFTLEAGAETYVELPFTGPDPSRFVELVLQRPLGVGDAPIQLRLIDADGVERVLSLRARSSPGLHVYGLGRAPYRAVVDDPRFETFERRGIERGATVTGSLIGRGTLQFQVDAASEALLRGASCSVVGVHGRLPWSVDLPTDGRLRLGPGEHWLRLDLADGRAFELPPVVLAAGEEVVRPLAIPPAVNTTLRMVDDRGQAVAGVGAAVITIELNSGGVVQDLRFSAPFSDSEGRLQVRNLSEGARVTVSLVGTVVLGPREFIAVAGDVEVTLPPAGTLTLVARLPEEARERLSDYDVRVRHTGIDGQVQDGRNSRLTEDPVTLTLPPGRVDFLVVHRATGANARTASAQVSVGEHVELELDLRTSLSRWRRMIVLVDAQPWHDSMLKVLSGGPSLKPLETRVENGELSLLAVPGTESILVAAVDGTWAQELSQEHQPMDRSALRVDVTRVRRRVRFLDPAGQPIPLAGVAFTRAMFGLELAGRLGPAIDGYAMASFSPGPVSFHHPGCAPIEVEWSEDLDDAPVLTFEEE